MNHKRTCLMLAATGAMLLGLAALDRGAQSRLATASALQAIEAAESLAVNEDAKPQRRRARASLSMPYFSFAQSLRPRG